MVGLRFRGELRGELLRGLSKSGLREDSATTLNQSRAFAMSRVMKIKFDTAKARRLN